MQREESCRVIDVESLWDDWETIHALVTALFALIDRETCDERTWRAVRHIGYQLDLRADDMTDFMRVSGVHEAANAA